MTEARRPALIIVMGTSGCGQALSLPVLSRRAKLNPSRVSDRKSTVGLALAEALAIPFVDGDDLHPAKNVAKMSAGHPLTDEVRILPLPSLSLSLSRAAHPLGLQDRIPWLHRIREDAILLTSRPGLDLLDAHPDAPPSNPARDDDPSSVPPELTLALSRIQPASLRARAIANERGERGRGRPRREGVVVACSALKREYRELLRGEPTRVSTGAAESPSSASSEPSSVVREGKHLDQEIETFFVYRKFFFPLSLGFTTNLTFCSS